MSCYYEVDREFEPGEMIPVGRPFPNTDILLLDENDREAKFGKPGEICIRGTPLTLGYYMDFERTADVFVQNPLNNCYPELIYRTGDIGRYNERGELVFISRKDNQIKHMGHRIELGEIELAVNMHAKVNTACCIFDDRSKKIVLYYAGDASKAEVAVFLKERLPRYMVPNIIELLDRMPLTANGKIDRVLLKEKYNQK
jgi:acyl-coenzyme A synthetase/AMP-(fatty) acid ligase